MNTLGENIAEIIARINELEKSNLKDRLTYLEQQYAAFGLEFKGHMTRANNLTSHIEAFEKIEKRLNKRMKVVEAFIKMLAQVSYEQGFYEPDKSAEVKRIGELVKELEAKDKRIAEIEQAIKALVGKK